MSSQKIQKDSHNSAYFNDYDLQPINFQIDNIKYEFDLRYMVWKTELIQEYENIEHNDDDQIKKKSHKQMDVRKQYDQNKKQIAELNLEINKLNENITKYQERLQQSQTEQQQLIEQYVHEHLETEKVKAARERLEKLKKELGL